MKANKLNKKGNCDFPSHNSFSLSCELTSCNSDFFLRIVIYWIKLPLLVTKYELQDIESQLRVIKSELQDILAILTYFLPFFYRICDINLQLRYKVQIAQYKLAILRKK